MDKTLTQPTTGLGSTAETNRLLGGNYFNTSTGAQVQKFDPVISAERVAGNTSPVSIPQNQVSTTAEGISGMAQAMSEQAKLAQQEAVKAQEAQTESNSLKDTLSKAYEKIIGVQTSRPELEKQAGLDVKAQALTDATNKIEASQRAQTNELRALENSGLGEVQIAQRQREINRRYAFEQADLALIQSAANRDLDTASKIIDRKIQLQLEPLQTQLDFTKFFYQENKDTLSKAEDRAFNLKIKSLDQQYETEKANKTAIANIQLEALKNGVQIPSSVLSQLNKAKDAAEATSILAANGISLQNPLDVAIKNAELKSKLAANVVPGQGTDAPLYNGLNSATATAVRQNVSSFKTEPIVQNFAVVQEGRNFAKSLADTTVNPADDQALIYALAKALDPGSVVREGEYATAQKYAQSWINAYGKAVTQAIAGTGFLSQSARKNIKDTIETKYKSSETSYNNLYNQYGKQINNLTGRADGSEFLRDYKIEEVPQGSVDYTSTLDNLLKSMSGK